MGFIILLIKLFSFRILLLKSKTAIIIVKINIVYSINLLLIVQFLIIVIIIFLYITKSILNFQIQSYYFILKYFTN